MNMTPNPSLETHILDLSRQAQAAPLSDWFATTFRTQIAGGLFAEPDQLRQDMSALIDQLVAYRENSGLKAAVVGMSGGVDSALTAALFREAGWQVLGYTLPIHQNPEETNRGEEACAALGIAHQQVDLTAQYQSMLAALAGADPDLADTDQKAARIRCGNIRARLRMITLYNQAHRHGAGCQHRQLLRTHRRLLDDQRGCRRSGAGSVAAEVLGGALDGARNRRT